MPVGEVSKDGAGGEKGILTEKGMTQPGPSEQKGGHLFTRSFTAALGSAGNR